jgi:isoamylase
MRLVLFNELDMAAGRSTLEIELDEAVNRSGDVWHIMLPALDNRMLYGASRCGGGVQA